MKKYLLWFLVTLLLAGSCAVSAQGAAEGFAAAIHPPARDDKIGIQRGTKLIVGNTTKMAGCFATDMWGTNTADMDVRALLVGYQTVEWTQTLGLNINGTAVKSVETESRANGNRVFILTLNEELTYNNGAPLTAQDYVFTLLLYGAPEVAEVGGTQLGMSHIFGFDAYMRGEADTIAGVRLVSRDTFSLEIDGQFLPFFYGLGMINVIPYPISAIAPGCEVRDTPQGVRLGPSPEAAGMYAEGLGYIPGEFSADMLRVTLLDEEDGYIYHPKVTCGPYSLESFDQETGTATLVINEHYLGNHEGQRPHIERLVYKHVVNETMFDELLSGDVDLINKVALADSIDLGISLASKENIRYTPYLRTGLTLIAFACELDGPPSSEAVRKAIAYCFDKRVFTLEILGAAYGLPVFGYYGLGQWMYSQHFEEDPQRGLPALDTQAAVEALEIPKNLDIARALLESDGWTLGADGQPFAEGEGAIRHRMDDGGWLERLSLRWGKTEGSVVAELIEETLAEPFAALGINLEITEIPFDEVLMQFYRQKERAYDMLFLASNFNYIFDPYYDFNTADEFQGKVNTTGIRDERMMELGRSLRETDPGDMHTYVLKWLEFQRRFVEVMPLIPLYSNLYYDFYPAGLREYNIAQHSGWGLAILYAYMDE